MKAISVRQPWAWLIVEGSKDIENRSWATSYRGPLLIQAGLRSDKRDIAWANKVIRKAYPKVTAPPRMLTGCIVGIVDVVDCVEWHDSDWFNGPFGWVLANPRVLKPCPCKGKLGLFEFDYPYLLEETDPIPLLFEISG